MALERIKDFDDITAFLGNYGRFQILMIVLLSVSAMPCGYMGVIVVFVSDTPEHHCKVWINSTRNDTDVEAPFQETSSWIGPDSCSRYKRDGDWTEAAELRNDTEKCLDGWVYNTERYTIVSEVHDENNHSITLFVTFNCFIVLHHPECFFPVLFIAVESGVWQFLEGPFLHLIVLCWSPVRILHQWSTLRPASPHCLEAINNIHLNNCVASYWPGEI